MLIDNDQSPDDELPGGLASIAASLTVVIEQRLLDIITRPTKLLSLLQRMSRPPNRYGVIWHRVCRLPPAPSFLRAPVLHHRIRIRQS